VAVVRTPATLPDPAGVVEVGHVGGDRILRVEGAREEFALLPPGAGHITVEERRAGRARLRVRVALPAAVLSVSRTFDPNWRARLDGAELALRPADGFLMAAEVPQGEHEIVLTYRNSASAGSCRSPGRSSSRSCRSAPFWAPACRWAATFSSISSR
jgi:hypothetical protein